MDPKKVKEELGILTVDILDKHGMLRNGELLKEVELFGTTDKYAVTNKQMMVTASVNRKDDSFVILSNGTETADKELRIDQIYVDRPKAALILNSILRAFPSLMEVVKTSPTDKTNIPNTPNSQETALKSTPDIGNKPFQSGFTFTFKQRSVDQLMGYLKKKILDLEFAKSLDLNHLTPLEGIITIPIHKGERLEADPDKVIDQHIRNKTFASQLEEGKIGTVETYSRKDKTFYIGYNPESKGIKFIDSNVKDIVNQELSSISPEKISNFIVIDKTLATKLTKIIQIVFPNEDSTDLSASQN